MSWPQLFPGSRCAGMGRIVRSIAALISGNGFTERNKGGDPILYMTRLGWMLHECLPDQPPVRLTGPLAAIAIPPMAAHRLAFCT